MLKLHPYQVEGASFLADRRYALLADDMGIGKSAQAVRACDMVGAETITVIAPAILRENWRKEFGKFAVRHRPIAVVKTLQCNIPRTGIVLVSFDLATDGRIQRELMERAADVLIIDESHNLKEHLAQRTIAIYGRYCKGQDCVASTAKRVWCLTGTPAPNAPTELYPMLRLFGQYEASFGEFLKRYATYTTYKDRVTIRSAINVEELRGILAPVMLRRMKADVKLQLPPLTIGEHEIEGREVDPSFDILPKLREQEPEAAAIIEQAMLTEDWSLLNVPSVSTVRRIIGLAKVRAIAELVDYELSSGAQKNAIVFCIHRDVLKYLQAYLRKYRAAIIYGGTPDEKKQNILYRFEHPDDVVRPCQVLLLQIKAAGVGLTITSCANVLIAEPSWTPADNEQAIMRCHRIGQNNPVLARFVSLQGSIDRYVNMILQKKAKIIGEVLR